MSSMLDFINATIVAENESISLEEFSAAMRSGDEQRKIEALEKMEAAGGYDNLT